MFSVSYTFKVTASAKPFTTWLRESEHTPNNRTHALRFGTEEQARAELAMCIGHARALGCEVIRSEVYNHNKNADGSFKSTASAASLAPFYGADVAEFLKLAAECVPERLDWFLDHVKQQATIAASYGRRALRQSKLR